MSKAGSTILAFLSGAAIGAGAGLLYAPEKGEKTRKRLNAEANKTKEKLQKQWEETSSNVNANAKKTLAEIEEKLDKALSSASTKADDIIVSLQNRLEELREQNKKLQAEVKSKKSAK